MPFLGHAARVGRDLVWPPRNEARASGIPRHPRIDRGGLERQRSYCGAPWLLPASSAHSILRRLENPLAPAAPDLAAEDSSIPPTSAPTTSSPQDRRVGRHTRAFMPDVDRPHMPAVDRRPRIAGNWRDGSDVSPIGWTVASYAGSGTYRPPTNGAPCTGKRSRSSHRVAVVEGIPPRSGETRAGHRMYGDVTLT